MVEPVRHDEVYGAAADAWNRIHPSGWRWSDLTSGERDEWLTTVTPVIRAVLEAQRESTQDGTFTCPIPTVAPLLTPLDKPEYVQEVWDAFVKPEQDAGIPQAAEMRLLMAILRAVHKGLSDAQ